MLLLLLTVFGPISMDLYLPVLPALTAELGAATSIAQLTVTSCLVGLAAGQLIAGPVSDRFGRRPPLYAGVVAFVAASLLCAASPSAESLILARFVQGLAGGVGIVVSQAAGRDLYSGRALVRYYSRMTVMAGLAAIIGPLLGGQLAKVTDWRGLFVFLAGIGALILAAIAVGFRETLPAEGRTDGGLAQTAAGFRTLLADRVFLRVVLMHGFVSGALFAYLAGATFVLQGIYDLSPQQYALAFGLNSAAFMVCGHVAGRTSERYSVPGTLAAGLGLCALGAVGLLFAGVLALPLAAVVVSLAVMVGGVAVTSPPATMLAMESYAHMAGTASSLLGMARFAFGGVSAPLVGLGGAATMLPLGVVTVTSVALAVAAYVPLTVRRTRRDDQATRASAEVSARRPGDRRPHRRSRGSLPPRCWPTSSVQLRLRRSDSC